MCEVYDLPTGDQRFVHELQLAFTLDRLEKLRATHVPFEKFDLGFEQICLRGVVVEEPFKI